MEKITIEETLEKWIELRDRIEEELENNHPTGIELHIFFSKNIWSRCYYCFEAGKDTSGDSCPNCELFVEGYCESSQRSYTLAGILQSKIKHSAFCYEENEEFLEDALELTELAIERVKQDMTQEQIENLKGGIKICI